MRLDLHTHSTHSDGTLSPRQLVVHASALGLSAIALTDHDSTDGLDEAAGAAQEVGITFVPGVELSVGPIDGRDIHMLAYFVDPGDAVLQRRLRELRAARFERARRMVEALDEAGYTVGIDDVVDIAAHGAVGRSHVAKALVARGHAATIADAFQRFIGHGQPFYHPKPATDPAEVVGLLVARGAIPVVAHPGVSGADDLLEGLVSAGLRGIEAYHADHTQEQMRYFAKRAVALGLLVTGGSDYHGPDGRNPELGSVALPDGVLKSLLDAGRASATTRDTDRHDGTVTG